jgi:hypothetical protein
MNTTTTAQPQRYRGRRVAAHGLLAVRALVVALAGYCFVSGAGRLEAASPPAPQPTAEPPARLRGYGVVAGAFTATEADGQSAGALQIVCENPEKAKLVHAKYLSDLQLLPGVERRERSAGPSRGEAPRSGGTPLSFYAVKDQGFVAAARAGAMVWILASPTVTGLEKLAGQNLGAGAEPVVWAPEVSVPMYLDRWDKYGFRFYYGPFVKPRGADRREVATYDPRQDFAFAKESGDVGLVVWCTPYGEPIPPYRPRLSHDLTDDWAYRILDGAGTAAPPEDASLADPKLDDSSWPRMRIGIFNLPDHTDARHVLFRKTFHVPPDWDRGRVLLFTHGDVFGGWRRYLDGKPLRVTATEDDLGGALRPGSTHSLAIEMWGPALPVGTYTPVFISYRPDPVSRQPVKDNWSYAPDRLTYGTASALPLTAAGAGAARTTVKIGAKESAYTVVVHVQAGVDGVIFNGRWLPGCTNIYRSVDRNVTPWVRFGQDNELIVVFHEKITIQEVSLEFYDKGAYP